MAGGITPEILEEIRSRCDIVDLIGAAVQLRRAGSDSYKGLCPFHQEKTPSFHVNRARQSYHCFGCGKGGDIFRFVMDRENLTFVDAVEMLASRVGVVIPEFRPDGREYSPGEARARANARERLFQVNEAFCEMFRRNLKSHPDGAVARYLAKRGLPPEIIERFKIGAAPEGWTGGVEFGHASGFTDEEMISAGLARRKEETGRLFDQFRERLTFTIENEQGRPVGFSARSLEPKPQDGRKYINTPETPVFKKGNLLYALSLARQSIVKHNVAVLCEGQMDVIAFHRAGFDFAVAPLGTAFTPEQAKILKRYTSRVILSFDADGAGEKAFLRAAEILLPLSMELKVIRIEGGKDPDELFNAGGAPALAEALRSARSWLDVLATGLPAKYDFNSPVGRSQAAAEVAHYLSLITNQVELEMYVAQSAKLLGVSVDAVYSELGATRRIARRREDFARPRAPETLNAAPKYPAPLLTLLELALNYPGAARSMAELLAPEELAGADPVTGAINTLIAAAVNDDPEEGVAQVRASLAEHPDPAVSRLLVEQTAYPDVDLALSETVASLRALRKRETRRSLLAQLGAASTDEERNRLLQMIQNSASGNGGATQGDQP